MISYFVSFAMRGGFGNMEIKLRLPVRGPADIKELAECAARSVGQPVVILSYQRFENPVPTEGAPAPGTVPWQIQNAPAGSAYGPPDLRDTP